MKYKVLITVGDGSYGALACVIAEFETLKDAEIAIEQLASSTGRLEATARRLYEKDGE